MTFDIEVDAAGEWSVIDQETNEVAWLDDVPLSGLDLDTADDMADLLNLIESTRPPFEH